MPSEIPSLENECFFIAPIGKDGSPERNRSDGVLNFIVALAAEELELTAVRADKISEPGQITLQVIDHVLGARAAVADLAGVNPNVFYELAARHTARLPVALIAEKNSVLPFDIAQMRTIFFDHTDLRSADSCRAEIVKQLREALENGAVDSPIATSVDVKTMQSGSVVERNVADLVTTTEAMAKDQRRNVLLLEELTYRLGADWLRNKPRAVMDDLVGGLERLESIARESNDKDLAKLAQSLSRPITYLVSNGRRSRLTTDTTTEDLAKIRARIGQLLDGTSDQEDGGEVEET